MAEHEWTIPSPRMDISLSLQEHAKHGHDGRQMEGGAYLSYLWSFENREQEVSNGDNLYKV